MKQLDKQLMVLLGDSSSSKIKALCQEYGIGRMLAQNWPSLYENEPWGFDNGAWGFRNEGWTPTNEGKFLVRLNRAIKIG